MNQLMMILIRLNNGNFKITSDAVILDRFYFDIRCKWLGLEEYLQRVVVGGVTCVIRRRKEEVEERRSVRIIYLVCWNEVK